MATETVINRPAPFVEDIGKGAEVMYNMMKNLEAGGEVSEESQGLKGAREMFQTSQRLGEVI